MARCPSACCFLLFSVLLSLAAPVFLMISLSPVSPLCGAILFILLPSFSLFLWLCPFLSYALFSVSFSLHLSIFVSLSISVSVFLHVSFSLSLLFCSLEPSPPTLLPTPHSHLDTCCLYSDLAKGHLGCGNSRCHSLGQLWEMVEAGARQNSEMGETGRGWSQSPRCHLGGVGQGPQWSCMCKAGIYGGHAHQDPRGLVCQVWGDF